MRKAFVLLPALGLAAPDFVTDFQPAILEQSPAQNNNTISEQGRELFKRSNCASGYAVCNSINRPDLCCQTNQVCSADSAGNAACCPINAACTGTLGVIVGITSSISVSATTVSSQTTNFATPTTTGSFVQATNGAQSTVSNPYYPFPIIATTYTAAAACSSAYTKCQSDAASCTSALASGQNGITVSAPNGGVTVTALASLGQSSAQSICQSLSATACSGLQVEACQAFGGSGAATRVGCGRGYAMGAAALGVAGQLLR